MSFSRSFRYASKALRAYRAPSCCMYSQQIAIGWKATPRTTSVSSPARRSRIAPIARRYLTTEAAVSAPEPPDYLSEGELHIFEKVKKEFEPVKLEVQDISGGCGSMYAIEIESAKFQGLTMIKQHKLVNQVLAEEIKSWHGVQLRTRAA